MELDKRTQELAYGGNEDSLFECNRFRTNTRREGTEGFPLCVSVQMQTRMIIEDTRLTLPRHLHQCQKPCETAHQI